MRDRRRSECNGKKQYNSYVSAEGMLKQLRKYERVKHDKDKRGMHAYRCPHCHWWHLGHKKTVDGPRKRERGEDV